MRTDRELLELAAKASGVEIKCVIGDTFWTPDGLTWNPITDDADAFRLAVKLGLAVEIDNCDDATRVSEAGCDLIAKHMHFDGGPEAATRRAILRAAAEIGAQLAAQQNGEK
jgi:hypothetical protein